MCAYIRAHARTRTLAGWSPFPGNINQLVLKLSSYTQQLERTGGVISEFVNPKCVRDGPCNGRADAQRMRARPCLRHGLRVWAACACGLRVWAACMPCSPLGAACRANAHGLMRPTARTHGAWSGAASEVNHDL